MVFVGSLLPHGSVVIIVHLMDFIIIGASVVLLPHGILVHGSIGLGGGVVGRRNAITGLTAVVAVPVVGSTVWIVICANTVARGTSEKARLYLCTVAFLYISK